MDINTVCINHRCRTAKFCLRYRAKRRPGQHTMVFEPKADAARCGNYLSITPDAELEDKK